MAQIMLKSSHHRSRSLSFRRSGLTGAHCPGTAQSAEGYEDDHGFHTVHQDTGGQVKKSGRSTNGDFCLQDL
jgi:hypothetical protein